LKLSSTALHCLPGLPAGAEIGLMLKDKKAGQSLRNGKEGTDGADSENTRQGDRSRLADNVISLYVLQGLNYLIPIAVLPYLVRVLGLDMYGLMAFAQSFAQYFTILTDYGFGFSATRDIARQRDDNEAISRIFCSVLTIKLALLLLGAVVAGIVIAVVPRFHHNAPFFLAAYLAVVGNTLFPVWYFQGIERMRYISVVIGISKLAAAIALFAFVHRPQDALLAITIQSLGTLVGGAIGFVLAFGRFHIQVRLPRRQDLRTALVEGWHLFISTAAVSLYANTNVFLVGLIAGNIEAGYFSAADKLIRAMQGLTVPVAQAVFPHVNQLVSQSRERALRFTREMLKWIGAITLLPSALMLIFARQIATLAFGHAAIGSTPVLRWIAFLPFVIALSNIFGVQTMIPFGLDVQFSRILILAGVFNIILAVPLIHIFGAAGAGMSVLATEVSVTFAMFVLLERQGIHVFNSREVDAQS